MITQNQRILANISKLAQSQALGHTYAGATRQESGYVWGCGYKSPPTQSLEQARNNYRRHALTALEKV